MEQRPANEPTSGDRADRLGGRCDVGRRNALELRAVGVPGGFAAVNLLGFAWLGPAIDRDGDYGSGTGRSQAFFL